MREKIFACMALGVAAIGSASASQWVEVPGGFAAGKASVDLESMTGSMKVDRTVWTKYEYSQTNVPTQPLIKPWKSSLERATFYCAQRTKLITDIALYDAVGKEISSNKTADTINIRPDSAEENMMKFVCSH